MTDMKERQLQHWKSQQLQVWVARSLQPHRFQPDLVVGTQCRRCYGWRDDYRHI